MTPLDVQGLIYDAILKRGASGAGKWYLVIKSDELVCVPKGKLKAGQISFGIITETDGLLGLEQRPLNLIVAKILVYLRITGKCLTPLKQ